PLVLQKASINCSYRLPEAVMYRDFLSQYLRRTVASLSLQKMLPHPYLEQSHSSQPSHMAYLNKQTVGILHDKSLKLLLKTSVQNALQKHKEVLIVQRVVQNSEKSLKYKVALLSLPQGMLAQNAASLLVQNRLINLLYL